MFLSGKLSLLGVVFIAARFESATGQCGVNSITKRIIGGGETIQHEFPWQAAIRWRVGIAVGKHVCGGSLITPNFVITAAHCFAHGKNPLYYEVMLGDHERGSLSSREQLIYIKNITIHPKYNEMTYDNDIALIEFSTPALLNKYVNPVCLPSFIDFEFPGMLCTITGWGGTHIDKTISSTVLNKVQVPIVNYQICNHARSYAGKLTGNMFCAGYANGSADTCQGDSGGPLQCVSRRSSTWVLNGITSWGKGCGTQHKYGVYVIVRHYLTWIKQITSKSTLPPIPKTTQKPPIPPVQTSKPTMIIPPIPTKKLSSKIPPMPSKTPTIQLTQVPSRKPSMKIAPIPSKQPSHGTNIPPIPTRQNRNRQILHSNDGKSFKCNNVAKTKTMLFLLCKRKV